MIDPFAIAGLDELPSPSLLFFADRIEANLRHALAIAGDPGRLRPHIKTHKTREITALEIAAGISKHKCATLSEARLLAECGAREIFVAYPLVGPNCRRFVELALRFPHCELQAQADHPDAIAQLSRAAVGHDLQIPVLVDLDVGQERTGTGTLEAAIALYRQLAATPGLRPGGIHFYDGHNRDRSPEKRAAMAGVNLARAGELRERLQREGLPVKRVIASGTPTFPIYAASRFPDLELSPGTFILHDRGYRDRFADLAGFQPAAAVLCRVISRTGPTRLNLDVGTKAIASDPPFGERCQLIGLAPFTTLLHNEEHLAIDTATDSELRIGDTVLAIPEHVCPTVALYPSAWIVRQGKIADRWEIAARDRG
jgi:D-serine deaminase-like pyridoxal phosphate-dependent protein